MHSDIVRFDIDMIKHQLVLKYGKDAKFSDLDEDDQLQLRVFQMQLETAHKNAGATLFVLGTVLAGVIALAVFVLLKS